MTEHSLAIVGGGPFCTYALERLAAMLPGAGLSTRLHVHIFDRTGNFGAGATHSDRQARTSYMNRVASQIAFAADESNVDWSRLLPKTLRPTFFQWSQTKYRETGDERFNLPPSAVPHRYLHGEALRESFEHYLTALREAGVAVELHAAEVTDLSRDGDSGFRLQVGGDAGRSVRADHVLLVTGHSNNHPAPGSTAEALTRHSRMWPPARYIPHAYPLEAQFTEKSVPPGCSVAVLGMGLTAVDVILHLTEGRGGAFMPADGAERRASLRYVPSGREPAAILAVSPSGMFTSCRPENEKAADGTAVGHSALQHEGVFLTVETVRRLRETVGVPAVLRDGEVRQLDFELHVFPLVVLEMAYLYYTTLFGKHFGRELREAVDERYRAFLLEGCASRDAGVEYLLEPVQALFEDVAAYVRAAESGAVPPDGLRRFDGAGVLEAFLLSVYGEGDERRTSHWGHSADVYAHRFDWRALFYPLGQGKVSGEEWRRRLVAYMRADNAGAAQGNLRNPVKAACDGVWRDLRSVFSEAVDFGGLTARSQRQFMETYFRLYTRMSNGTGLEAMGKVLALVEAGVVDVSTGPAPVIEPLAGRPLFLVKGTVTGTRREVGVVAEGRVPAFDPELDVCTLYPNMFRRGIVRRWRNPAALPSDDFYPGGLDVSQDFHPVQADGSVERRLTILGAPVEGVLFFQLSAARPQSNSSILNNAARWAKEFIDALASGDSLPAHAEHDTVAHK
jgi:uncharacterized NAD(P)/FAD-binding protein YdhS